MPLASAHSQAQHPPLLLLLMPSVLLPLLAAALLPLLLASLLLLPVLLAVGQGFPYWRWPALAQVRGFLVLAPLRRLRAGALRLWVNSTAKMREVRCDHRMAPPDVATSHEY